MLYKFSFSKRVISVNLHQSSCPWLYPWRANLVRRGNNKSVGELWWQLIINRLICVALANTRSSFWALYVDSAQEPDTWKLGHKILSCSRRVCVCKSSSTALHVRPLVCFKCNVSNCVRCLIHISISGTIAVKFNDSLRRHGRSGNVGWIPVQSRRIWTPVARNPFASNVR